MFNSKKSQYGRLLSAVLCMFLLVIFTSPAAAVDLPFDPNDFSFLIYNPGGTQSKIIDSMEHLADSQACFPAGIVVNAAEKCLN